MDYQSFGAVMRLLAVASMFVTVISNFWRHGDIDLTGRHANMRTIYGRAIIIGVVLAAIARLNVIAMLRPTLAFDPYLDFYGMEIADDVIGVLVTGVVLGFLSKFWNDLFDLLFELKRLVRGKANMSRADEQPRQVREREPRNDMRDMRDNMRRGRRGSRGGRGGMGGGGGGDRPDRADRPDRPDRGERPDRDRGDRGGHGDRDRGGERPLERTEVRRPDFSREPSGGSNP